MFANIYTIIVISLAAVTLSADHAVTFTNNYGLGVRPIIKNTADGATRTRPRLGRDQSWLSSIAENWLSGIMVEQANEKQDTDCVSCSRVECDFPTSNFRNCNLLRVAGFHVRMSFSWTAGGCTGATCNPPSCPPSDTWNHNSDEASSLRFFNTPRVAITVVFCP
ncbi:structural constituent of cell wall, partial [Rhizoctonia solani]